MNLANLSTAALLAIGMASASLAQTLEPADTQTQAIVASAQAFLGTLSEDQQSQVLFSWEDDVQRSNWSNFPDGAVIERQGLTVGEMTETQYAALFDLLGTVLSDAGVENVRLQLASDDATAAMETGVDEDNGRPPVNFGSDYYYVSFLGAPSEQDPWMLQFGGHHLAINATVAGPDVALSPMLTGGEPLKFELDGTPVYIVEDEAAAAMAFMASLEASQLDTVVIDDTAINLVLGPGEDGKTLPPEGLTGAEMSDDQQALFLELIEARIGFLNADDLAPRMEEIAADLDQTAVAWWGAVEPGAGYYRIVGPTVIIEFSPEGNDGDPTDHAHNIYRNPQNDYGASWASYD